MKITSKSEFFRLWNAGALGFKLRTWETLEALQAEPNKPPIVGFREVGKAGGGKLEIEPVSEAPRIAAEWNAAGRRFMICEAAPDEMGTIQGEVCRTIRGLEGLLGFSNGLRMRDAIAAGLLKPRSASETLVLLRDYMSAPSRDDLEALLDLYPDATVEFTCYGSHDFERGRNTIFWEVRDY
jgi:hypothetical protein